MCQKVILIHKGNIGRCGQGKGGIARLCNMAVYGAKGQADSGVFRDTFEKISHPDVG